jgi:hypothetical protein
MAHWKKFFSGKHLESADLPDDGRGKATIKIVSIGMEEVEEGKKGLITFEPSTAFGAICKKRTWLAATTVGHQLAKMFGPDPGAWVGKKVVVYAADVNGEPALRVWGSPDIAEACEVSVREFRGGKRRWKMVRVEPPPVAADQAVAS